VSKASSRIVELCLEATDRVADVVEQLDEFIAATAHSGAGVHRDPVNILAELRGEVHDLRATLREQRDEIEREARGFQS
jgi:hypothetical protein